MARKRMIDPNLWMSEDVGKLSVFERLLLIGMFSNADDEGKGRANPPLLRSVIFPYDDFSVNEIEAALEHITKVINLQVYEVEGSRYYKFTNWKKWQRVDKIQKSIIPEPVQNDSKNDSKNDSRNGSENGSRMSSDEEKRREEKRREENIKEENIKEEKGDSLTLSLHIEKITNGKWYIAKDIEKLNVLIEMYTYNWVKDALNEATLKGKFSISYAEGILKVWTKEGRRDTGGSSGKDNDSSPYDFTGLGG